ncbi:START-like domain-containing protein [Algivirga pacifica]|uniref:START-like domain-containing protein n=1 Tax=Algivirga pacifica TaxID=1162670 RepID=A0ABP9DE32_9BACT
MPKYKYRQEFEVNASVKMLYPYFSTAKGLSEWIADEVRSTDQKDHFVFVWNGEERPARMVIKRKENHLKYAFAPTREGEDEEPSYVEFLMDFNEMTQTTFVKVIDYSDMDDEEELNDLWGQFFEELRTLVGA